MSIAHTIFLQVQALPEDKAQEVLDFARFLAQHQSEKTIYSHSENEWDWLDHLTPFDDHFEKTILDEKVLIQEREQLSELFK